MRVALAARDPAKLAALCAETGARAYACNASDAEDVARLFAAVDADLGAPRLVVYNPSARVRGPVADLDPAQVQNALQVSAFGGFLVAQQAARRMLAVGRRIDPVHRRVGEREGLRAVGGVRDGQVRAARARAERWRANSRRKGIHVAHFVIDGGIRQPGDPRAAERGPDGLLDPDAIAQTYLQIHDQPRSAWTWEVELRPWTENF